ncbi:M81 family metallopeptidase [Bordetella genomosp. 13]|uniref:M81 family metallopeptidase n=1 Tax=Bordetella genomosp. 13 TaxID=463040 RepID=UPI0011A2AC3A|nr:M81 family metallopeptidase [Bordetella genomosp. 13]
MTRKRLAVARFWFEGNAFCPAPTTFAHFEQYEWRSGAQALEAMRGTATELGAVARFADTRPDWDVVVLRCASALPGGPIDEAVLQRYTADLRQGLADGPWDAVYLSLHGAAITRHRETPELDIARMVRAQLPEVPLGASFDLHGNMPADWAALLDVASVYRTHPHVDMDETAQRVLDGLVRCVEQGLRTRRVLLNERVVLPSINMRTAAGPMHELEAAARTATTGPVLEVSVFGGFPYSDTAWTGASVMVSSDAAQDPEGDAAAAAARRVMDRVHDLAGQFRLQLPTPADAVSRALHSEAPGLLAVTDSGDNPMSGGASDTPGLFRALLDARPQVPSLYAGFAAPDVVQAAVAAGQGGTLDVVLGGRHGPHFGPGVAARVSVERLTNGIFRNSGPMQTGVERQCGRSAVLKLLDQPSVRVIVTERVVALDDPALYALHGIDLDALRLLCVKAKNHFRAAFADRCAEIIDCDAPGPACQDLSQLPFRNPHIAAGYP